MNKKLLLASCDRLFSETLALAAEKNEKFNFDITVSDYETISDLQRLITSDVSIAVLHVKHCGNDAVYAAREIVRLNRRIRFVFIIDGEAGGLQNFVYGLGFSAVITVKSGIDDFYRAVNAAMNGERYINTRNFLTAAAEKETAAENYDLLSTLTHREREVLYWAAHGLTNEEISQKMILSIKTVKNHISHLLKKLDVTDRTKAAAIAWSEGLPQISEDFFANSSGFLMSD